MAFLFRKQMLKNPRYESKLNTRTRYVFPAVSVPEGKISVSDPPVVVASEQPIRAGCVIDAQAPKASMTGSKDPIPVTVTVSPVPSATKEYHTSSSELVDKNPEQLVVVNEEFAPMVVPDVVLAQLREGLSNVADAQLSFDGAAKLRPISGQLVEVVPVRLRLLDAYNLFCVVPDVSVEARVKDSFVVVVKLRSTIS